MSDLSPQSPSAETAALALVTHFAGLMQASVVHPVTTAANDSAACYTDADAGVADDDARPGAGRDGHQRGLLRQTIGVRLVRARTANGLTQGEFSRRLGYTNQTQLALWERGARLIPMTELVRVCEVLGVSESYILGTCNELERDPSAALRHACLRGVRNMLGQVAELTLNEIERHAKLVGPHAQHERTLLRSGGSLLEALSVVDRLNTNNLDDIPGWATVLRVKDDFEVALEDARQRIAMHDRHDSDLRQQWSAIRDADQADMDDEG